MRTTEPFSAITAAEADVLAKVIKFLMLAADGDVDFLTCMPNPMRDARLLKTEIAIKSQVWALGVSQEAAPSIARAYAECLVLMLARRSTNQDRAGESNTGADQ